MPVHTLYTCLHSKLEVCMTCSGSKHPIRTQLNHYRVPHDAVYVDVFSGQETSALQQDVYVMFSYSQLIQDGWVSGAGLNGASSLSIVSHRTLTKDSTHAGFFNPFKLDAGMSSNVCWLSVRKYPLCAQWHAWTLLSPHVNLQMLDPHTVIFWFVGQAPYLYVIDTGMVPGMEIIKSQYTDVVFSHLHVEKAVCMNITWHKQDIDVL